MTVGLLLVLVVASIGEGGATPRALLAQHGLLLLVWLGVLARGAPGTHRLHNGPLAGFMASRFVKASSERRYQPTDAYRRPVSYTPPQGIAAESTR